MYKRMNAEDLELLLGIDLPDYDGCFGKGKDGITEKQKSFLHSLGLNVVGVKYKAQASILIDTCLKRKELGLASIKQLQFIRNMDACPKKKSLHELTKDEASKILQRIAG